MSQRAKNSGDQKSLPNLFPAKAEPLSPFYAMLQSAPEDYLLQQEEQHALPPEYPVSYFFYGTLTAPSQLQRILDLPEEPSLRKVEVFGYTIAKWGDHPARSCQWETGAGGNRIRISRTVGGRSSKVVVL